MNSKQCDEAFMALLEAEVREQEQQEVNCAQPIETTCQTGRKGPTLHFKGKGRQGFQLTSVSGRMD